MIETIKENGDDDIAFLHLHEWSLGIMMYYFPDAEHYVCDDTWCVLNTLDVFPTEVTDIGSIDNINKHSKNCLFLEICSLTRLMSLMTISTQKTIMM